MSLPLPINVYPLSNPNTALMVPLATDIFDRLVYKPSIDQPG